MSDSLNHLHALPRDRVVEVIERSTADAVRQLREAGIPETEALAVIRRFTAFSVQVLRELDALRREYEQLRAEDPDRSQEHQEWFDTKLGGMLLTIEDLIAALVVEAINKAKADYRTELSKRREVIVMPPHRPAVWEEVLQGVGRQLGDPFLLWFVGLIAWFFVWFLVSGSVVIAVIALGVTAFMGVVFEQTGLVLSALFGGACLLLLMLL